MIMYMVLYKIYAYYIINVQAVYIGTCNLLQSITSYYIIEFVLYT